MKKSFGFTLAEVLITLGIIGVVAAMTLPTLIQNYQKKTYIEGLKVGISILEQGFKAAMADDGVDDLADTTLWKNCDGTDFFPARAKSGRFGAENGADARPSDAGRGGSSNGKCTDSCRKL